MFTFIQESFQVYFQRWIEMNPLFVLIIVWFLIQLIKVVADSIKYKKLAFIHIFAAWWFPSFHAGIVTSVTTMILIEFGFDSLMFALASGFALLFAYDSMNVRFQSGKQAEYINEIRLDLKSVLTKQEKWIPLKERLWHTPIEVLWWIFLWLVVTFILYYSFVLN